MAKEYAEDPRMHVVAVSSVTIGLTITLEALGITGEVLVPSFTFCASANAIVQAGATSVFVDSCPETYNISVSDLEKKITKQTEAILAVHVFGVPADCLALEKIAKGNNIKLIFDAAHGMGSTLNNVKMGRFGDAEVFSTTPTKTLVTGEGGLVFTRDAALAQRLRIYREYGNPGDCTYIGTNGRLNEISCLMGIASFDLLPEHLRLRQAAAKAYAEKLTSIPGIHLQQIPALLNKS
ncbi:DegT/DnrJ/EryC1/StrS family aminotransferase [Sodalis glossinidius]|uniref:DegT/DnrJ/EryC1/StrS family aminotransferase n=1 Tax=Sodalis glossinidius TaxID=63612 RepID=UPI0003240DBF|nr:DegT/DnrJ/EryC1/StrS family aminotransferase [Sodalis glossinidius]